MSAPVIAFFNNKGGVGKTSLVYHLAWMYADLGHRVIAVDLDPQANLTAAFLSEDEVEALWDNDGGRQTVYGAIEPLLEGESGLAPQQPSMVDDRLWLLAGDLALAKAEAEMSQAWPQSMDRQPRAFRVLSAFSNIIQYAAEVTGASLALVDVGPNLGAINRAALIASDFVVVPLGPDLFSLQGLRNLGPTLRDWRREWHDRRDRVPRPDLALPVGRLQPLGYVVLQHRIRAGTPTKAYQRWMNRIPEVYLHELLGDQGDAANSIEQDPRCLGQLKHYHSLMAMAQEARKPIFNLKPADGALGGHLAAAQSAYRDFKRLAHEIERRMDAAS